MDTRKMRIFIIVLQIVIICESSIRVKAFKAAVQVDHRRLDDSVTPTPTVAPTSDLEVSSSKGNGRIWWRRWRDHMRPSRTFKKNSKHSRNDWTLVLWIFIWFFAVLVSCCCLNAIFSRCRPLLHYCCVYLYGCGGLQSSCCDTSGCYCSLCPESDCECGTCYACSDCCAWSSDRLNDTRLCCADCCLMSTVCILGACCCRRDVVVRVADNSQQANKQQTNEIKRQDVDEFDREHQHGFAVRKNEAPPPSSPAPKIVKESIPYAYAGNYWSTRHTNNGSSSPYHPPHNISSPGHSPYHRYPSQQPIPMYQAFSPVRSPYLVPLSPPPHAQSPKRILDDADFIGHNYVDNYGPHLPPPAVANQRRINENSLNRRTLGSPLPPPAYPPHHYPRSPPLPMSPGGYHRGGSGNRLLF